MRIGVAGLWHLGCVTAAGMASVGHDVLAFDFDADVIDALEGGRAPSHEHELDALIRQGADAGTLAFTSDVSRLADVEILWLTFDTPVGDDDSADVAAVLTWIDRLVPSLAPGSLVLISSQVPVGTTRVLQQRHAKVEFAYSPENLRLGAAVDAFLRPARIVVGADSDHARGRVCEMLSPITDRIELMSVASAELSKHAINAFLGTSVAFANELAGIAERVGADASDVERALRTEPRIGPRAYVSAGAAFAGGTLARDLTFLESIGQTVGAPTRLVEGVLASNREHARWAFRVLQQELGELRGRRVAVLGLAYKVDTSTLRRSPGVELVRDLVAALASVVAHDPMASPLPDDLHAVERVTSAADALVGAAAIVVSTPWPEYRTLTAEVVRASMTADPVVVDAAGFLDEELQGAEGVRHRVVGRPT